MEKHGLLRPKSGTSGGSSGRSASHALPKEVLEEGSRRLSWSAFFYSGGFFLAYFPGYFVELMTGRVEDHSPISLITAIVSIVFGFAVGIVARRGWLPHKNLLLIGFAFQVVAAFGIGFSENHWLYMRITAGDPIGPSWGISWICVWTLYMSTVLPAKPRRVLIAALVTGAMGPLAELACWLSNGSPAMPEQITQSMQVLRATPYFIAAGMAYVAARFIYKLGTDITKAKELGSYRLVELLGKGGMGEVWRAKHRLLARPAAIKLIRPDRLGATGGESTATALKRFEREAQATAALESHHTIGLFDFGVTEDHTFYYVMELLHGLDLESLVARFGPIPAERVVFLMGQACHSLMDAHDRGLIHRDIKPANLFTCRLGPEYDFVKVLDFGLVKAETEIFGSDASLTVDGMASGTPAYMPPEVAVGSGKIDERLDVYSLGCVAYWLLTGHRVFTGNTPMEVVIKHVKEEPEPPSRRTEMPVPACLEEIVLSCLAKEPEKRPQSARDLRKLFLDCDASEPWTVERAEKWWRTHLPQVVEPGPDETLVESVRRITKE